ncbi:hypothetical protein OKC48_11235 [Methylorubrum extorquens]|uniref:hypothetical protein n=1 Tax=Methylorubrum extorquens TaxID=408 RepID=UPI002237EC69|nr:hypothetical protein [Methylorubrum extorquens]UYW29043.1 hypothetical protein OKC48_11235 [Methylorubrum extorquens]
MIDMSKGDGSPQDHRETATDAGPAADERRLKAREAKRRRKAADPERYRQQRREEKARARARARAATGMAPAEPAAPLSAEQQTAREKNRTQRAAYIARDPERYRRQKRQQDARRAERQRTGEPLPPLNTPEQRRALKAARKRRMKEADPERWRVQKNASEYRRRARRNAEAIAAAVARLVPPVAPES